MKKTLAIIFLAATLVGCRKESVHYTIPSTQATLTTELSSVQVALDEDHPSDVALTLTAGNKEGLDLRYQFKMDLAKNNFLQSTELRIMPEGIIALTNNELNEFLIERGLNGEEGFTGEMKVTVIYSLTEENELCIEYLATTNKTSIVALTNHAFFSLGGIKNPTATVDNQILEMNADFYLPIDEESIPTGEILKVAGTPFDFRKPKAIGLEQNADNEQIKNGSGYDHNFVLNKKEEGELSFAARLTEPESGRTLEVYTTEPGCQLYCDNFVRDIVGPEGATFPRRCAVCLETQHFPDSPNRNYFPSVVLRPGERLKSKTIYKFGVVE